MRAQTAGRRIAIGGFSHESNSFAPSQDVGLNHFLRRRDRPPLLLGDQMLDELSTGSFPTTGFLQAIGQEHALVPLAWASGGAGGMVSDEAFEHVCGALLSRLTEAPLPDAIYLELHGAMATPSLDDPEAELLRRVREVVGEDLPIAVTLDYHANLSPAFARMIDGAVVYRTYPHVDRVACGKIAAALIHRLLAHGRSAGVAIAHSPFLIPLHAQCTLDGPSQRIAGQSLADAGEVVSRCYAAGFPLNDRHWCGPAIMVHADTQKAADGACGHLYSMLMDEARNFDAALWPVNAAVKEAIQRCRAPGDGPILLADVQDNPGAGAGSNTTSLLAELVRAKAEDALLGILCDGQAAAVAHAAGQGATIEVNLGQPAFAGRFLVERLGSGRLMSTGTVAGGLQLDLGPMALLRTGGTRIAVSSARMQAFDPAPFHHLGADPAQAAILALKSTCHFRADFAPLARGILLVEAPGDAPADPSGYPYSRLRPGVQRTPR